MDMIKEINEKFIAMEAEIDNKLKMVKHDEEKLEKLHFMDSERAQQNQEPKMLTHEQVMIRNCNLLKSLEMTKARIRSRSTFSPVEQILEKTLANYKSDLQISICEEKDDCGKSTENIYDRVVI